MSNRCGICEGVVRVNYTCDEDGDYTCNDCDREFNNY